MNQVERESRGSLTLARWLRPGMRSFFRGGSLFVVTLSLMLSWGTAAWGQNCPAPWATAANVVGVVSISGNGTATKFTVTQKTDQNATASVKMPTFGAQSCAFMAVRGSLGQIDSTANVNDSVSDSSSGNVTTWVGSGSGDYTGAQGSFGVISPTLYNFYVGDAVPGTLMTTGNPPASEELIWGPNGGGATLLNVPMAPGAGLVWGSSSFQGPPFESGQGAGLNANWSMDWMFAAMPDDDCEKCKQHDGPMKGSELSPQSQILGEQVELVGTSYFLHYESSRVPGHAGADLFAMKDALGLGGWTLSVHHVFDPLLGSYCTGGSCTPYAVVPKAIFFGYGDSRSDADVQAALGLNGNFLISAEDGSQVYVFNSKGQHLQTLRPYTGAVLYTFGYDSNSRLISVTDANGNVTSIQRDANGNPTSITGPFGQQTTLAVDANGFLSKITDPAGNATTLTNSVAGLLLTLTDPNGKKYTYSYDGLGLLTKHADPAGGSITLARTNTATGYSVKNTTAAGRNSTYAVAFGSNATQSTQTETTTWPNGLVATGTKTQLNGQVSDSVTLPNGNSTSTTLGPDPRWGMQSPILVSESQTMGNLTRAVTQTRTATLSDVTNPFSLTSQTDTITVNGNAYTYTYTAATKSLVSKTPVGRTTTSVLDAEERLSTVQPTGLALTTFTYDAQGRITSVAAGTRKTTFAFDTSGNLASTTNALNLTRKFTYDTTGNLLTTQLEDGRIANYGYDANGNLTSVTAPGGVAHTYGYSAINLATSYMPPAVTGSGATTYTFNADRDLTKVTRPDGGIITYKYDTSGRVTSMVAPSATMTYAYSATTGNITKAAVTGGESIAYAYNGSLPTRSTWTGTVAGTVARTYNNNFLIASESVTGGSNIAFAYDKDGLETKAGALTMTRAATTGLYSSGILGSTKDTYVYSTFAEVTSHTALFGTTTLYSAKYTRDGIGRITALTETIGGTPATYAYTYDTAGRLTSVKKGATVVSSYTYDQNSNRLTATTSAGTTNGTYDAQDRLLSYGGTAYTYTANGELVSKSTGAQLTSYQYDAMGNLTAATLPNGTLISYIVDAANRRVGKKVNGVLTTAFLYDGDELVAQLNGSNQVVSQFVYGAHRGAPEYMISGGLTYRVFSDQLGSPKLVVNSTTGQIVEQVSYDEFGNVVSDTNPGFQPFGFAGGLYDLDTGLVRFGARDYDSVTGRWTSKDPIRFDGGDTNLYGYVLNDPVNLIDPAGFEGTCPCEKGITQMTKDSNLTVKMPDQKTATNGPKLSNTPNLDRFGVTKVGTGPPADTPNPVSITKGGITVTPTSIEGTYRTLGGSDAKAGVNVSVTLDKGRTLNVKDGGSTLKIPFPINLDNPAISCYLEW